MPEQETKCRITVDFSALPPEDAKELLGAIVRILPDVSFSPDGVERRTRLFAWHPTQLAFLVPAGIYVGKKAIDIMADLVQRWLQKKLECKHRTIQLFGPDGELVKVVECDLKPHEKD